MKGVAKLSNSMKFKFAPNKLEVEGDVVDSDDVTIEVATSTGDEMEIEISDEEVSFKTKRVTVRARLALDFENGVLSVNGKKIKLPDEFMEDLNLDEGDFELTEDESGNAVYEGNVKKRYNLFAIIPINANVFLKANAENGQIMAENTPWWTVFATE